VTWLQVDLHVQSPTLAELESRLELHGAVALTLISDAAEIVLEPAPGETPIWSSVCLRALFPIDVDVAGLRDILADVPSYEIEVLAEEDWQAQANNHAITQVFAKRLWLLPKPKESPSGPGDGPVLTDAPATLSTDLTPLYLEPGLAFGSGSHPTTQLCLEWLAGHVQPGMRVLDFGCGSGVLGIAAALLGAEVVAVDHDPQAIVATRENAAYNGLAGGELTALELSQWQESWQEISRGSNLERRLDDHADQDEPGDAGQARSARILPEKGSHDIDYRKDFDVVVANILAAPLMDLAEEFEIAARNGAHIVLSGILAEQAEEVARAYQCTEFLPATLQEGWALLCGVRGVDPV